MRLYNSARSGNCYKVRLLLAHLEIEYETVEFDVIDRSNREQALGDKNPSLRVPTLEFEDGRALGESNAILWYLARGTDYLPKDPLDEARVLQWMFFEQNLHEPNIAVVRFWVSIAKTADRFPQAMELRTAGGHAALQTMDRHLDGHAFLAGEYSIADIALYAYTHVANEGDFDLGEYRAIQGWMERVRSQPGHVPM